MLTDDEKALIRQCYAALRDGMPGFKPRHSQLRMIAAVGETLGNVANDDDVRDGSQIAVLQSPCGVGKSHAYALPGVALAKARGKQLIISTSTTGLQHQLLDKDLPMLQRALPFAFTYALCKGRGRYVCASKLADGAAGGRQVAIQFPTPESRPVAAEEAKQDNAADLQVLVEMAAAYESGAWNGDKDDLKFSVSDTAWGAVTTDRQGCSGNRCPRFARCAFYGARERVKAADVVVTNHSLLLCALDMEPGSVLPDLAECFVVLDEAHTLTDKCIEHFAQKHSLRGAAAWIGDIGEVVSDVVHGLRIDASHHAAVLGQAGALAGYLEDLYQAVAGTGAFDEKPKRRFKNGVLPPWMIELGGHIWARATELQASLSAVRSAMLDAAEREPHLTQRLVSNLGFYLGKVENLVGAWALMLGEDQAEEAPTARWIEQYASATEKNDFLICASPISAAGRLAEKLWSRAGAVVLTSATLTACGSFDLFLRETGLCRFTNTTLLALDSPFDYPNRARLVVPRMKADPRAHEPHTAECARIIPEIITTRGTLALFASRRAMQECFAQLPEQLKPLVLMQGTLPKAELIARHKAAIDGGRSSVLFGLKGLAEGVDLPLEYCTHVIIQKLPFDAPDDPVREAQRDWIEQQGKVAFLELCVPEVGIRLAQAVGRLLRTDADYGTVTILDPRIATSHWGQMLMRGLPPFQVEVFGRQV